MINWRVAMPMLSALALWISPLFAQPPAPSGVYAPITGAQRVEWIVDGTIGRRSLGVGVIADAWQTAWNTPEEWGRGWSGVGKRYVAREADVLLSSSIEAGVAAMWGEDPRYTRATSGSIRSRIRYAAVTVNLIENAWLPPSVTTPSQTILRCATGFAGRLAGNLFEEFWPDVKRRFIH